MKIFLINTFFFVFFCFSISFSQIGRITFDTINKENFVSTNLDNNINSALLNSKINLNYDIKKINIIIRNNYSSDVTKLTNNFYRDFNDFNTTTNYILSDNFKPGIGIQYRTLSDNRGIEINKDKNAFYYSNFDYKPNNNFYVNSKIGIRNEEQIGEKNSGLGGVLSSEFNGLNLYNFITEGNLNLSYDRLTQKSNYNIELNTNIFKRFSDKSENKTIIRFYDRRSDFYIPATNSIVNNYNVKNNIQSRIESYIYLEDKLKYGILDNLNFNIYGVYIAKFINSKYKFIPPSQNILFENIYNAKVNENGFQAGTNLEFLSDKYHAKIWMLYSERVEQHNPVDIGELPTTIIRELEKFEKDKNNNSRNTSIVLEAIANLTNTQSLRFSGSSSILKYDTDSKDNYDDRDELNSILNISHKYDNLRNFVLETTFEYNVATLSYLFKEKSSNNYTNKIYRLTSRSIFSPVNELISKNSFQVLANYTVYKFEDIISKIQSFSFRQLMATDTTNYNISRNLFFDFFGIIKIYEQGAYNEKNFSERPLAYFDDRKFNAFLGYKFTENLIFSLGFAHFIQRQYIYDSGIKYLRRTISNYGPIGKIQFYFKNDSRIEIIGGKDYIESSENQEVNKSESLFINILWNI